MLFTVKLGYTLHTHTYAFIDVNVIIMMTYLATHPPAHSLYVTYAYRISPLSLYTS